MTTLIYAIDYNNIKGPRASTTAVSSPNTKRSSISSVLSQFKPTTETITPSGIYSPIIKRGSLFSGLAPTTEEITPSGIYSPIIKRGSLFSRRSSRTNTSSASSSPAYSRKHSVQQARVDAALLR